MQQLLIVLVNGSVESEDKPDASEDVEGPKPTDRTLSWIVVASTIAIFVGTLISYDLSDALLADFRRTEVLKLLKPGMSLTDAKTKVKAAGYSAYVVIQRQPLLTVCA